MTPWSLGPEIDGLRLHRRIAEQAPGVGTLILFRPEDVDRMEEAPLPPGVRLLADSSDAGALLAAAHGPIAKAGALRQRPSAPAA